ncbi:hypothetical protein CRG98_028034 [Punica granatum]|uniref:Uncharacterized protein n=1 Tax=Punica granatum TaxID=22663 RepID=A0A2I0J5R2_PUNGR|nr:hypothetical protein CRG98_028034 [Punica granatum]
MSGNIWIVTRKTFPTRNKQMSSRHARNDSKRDGETSWNPIRALGPLGYLQGEVTESLLDSYRLHEASSSRYESVLGFRVICNLHLCAPEFNLVEARMHEAYATRLGSVHLPGDARRMHVRRSHHLLFTTRRSRAVESPGSRGTGYT